jgi:hypothetical protein
MRTGVVRTALLIATLMGALPGSLAAQEQENQSPASLGEEWAFVVAPYFLFPHMNGTVRLAGIDASVDANPGDIFDKLKFGAMLLFEAHNGVWAVAFDGLYMDLGEDATNITASVGMDQGMFQLTGFRRVVPWLEVLLGGRINTLGANLDITLPNRNTRKVDQSKTWFDPFVGARVELPAGRKWLFAVRGDIGGFGIGSDLAWQVYPVVAFRASRLISVAAAYRVLYMDYDTGMGLRRFSYDVTTFGPEIGLAFHF